MALYFQHTRRATGDQRIWIASVDKSDIMAYFGRSEEQEVIVLDVKDVEADHVDRAGSLA